MCSLFCGRYAGQFDSRCVFKIQCLLLNEKWEQVCDFRHCDIVEHLKGTAWHKVSSLSLSFFGFFSFWQLVTFPACYGDNAHPTL
jgi:hypothetical protein